MLFQPYITHRTIHIGRNQYIFLRMLKNCMEEVGLTLPLRMDDIQCIMPDEYNESMRWSMLVSLHRKGLIIFNPMTGSIVDIDLSLLKHVGDALRRRHCRLYDYYQEPWDIRRENRERRMQKFWGQKLPDTPVQPKKVKKEFMWTKTVVKVPVCPDYHA